MTRRRAAATRRAQALLLLTLPFVADVLVIGRRASDRRGAFAQGLQDEVAWPKPTGSKPS